MRNQIWIRLIYVMKGRGVNTTLIKKIKTVQMNWHRKIMILKLKVVWDMVIYRKLIYFIKCLEVSTTIDLIETDIFDMVLIKSIFFFTIFIVIIIHIIGPEYIIEHGNESMSEAAEAHTNNLMGNKNESIHKSCSSYNQ